MTSSDTSMRAAATEVARDAPPVELKSRSARPPKAVHAPQAPPLRKSHRGLERPPFECIALVLQGGGALGAFQAGVYQALAEANLHPDWVSGISIGAINAALIAGNAPETRLDKLRAFWEQVTAPHVPDFFGFADNYFGLADSWLRGDLRPRFPQPAARRRTAAQGRRRVLHAEMPPPYLHPPGTVEATSWYDTAPLRSTLERLVDFDRINTGEMRFSVGAVNIRSGNFVYFDFDHAHDQARARHRQRRAAARLSPGRGRRRALLGRRARLQHAAAMGGGGRHPPGHARVPGRPVERARRGAERPERRHGAAEGDPVFEPDARQHRSVQGDPERARARWRTSWTSFRRSSSTARTASSCRSVARSHGSTRSST